MALSDLSSQHEQNVQDLIAKYPGVPPETVRGIYTDARRQIESEKGAKTLQFVPIIAKRQAEEALRRA